MKPRVFIDIEARAPARPDEPARLYLIALAADAEFSAELRRAYGPARSALARYRRSHSDPRVVAAMEAKLAADHAWHRAMQKARSA